MHNPKNKPSLHKPSLHLHGAAAVDCRRPSETPPALTVEARCGGTGRSTTFEQFTDEEWEAIRLLLPREEKPSDRGDIELTGRVFWYMRESRLQCGPPLKVFKQLEALQRKSYELQDALKALPDTLRPLAPNLDLAKLDNWLWALFIAFGGLAGPSFSRNRDAYRDWLYKLLLGHWEELGGSFSFSRKLDGSPYGPLINFLTLTMRAIAGKAPGPSGIAKIIERYRKAGDFPD
jgi:hypothetical protein